MTDPFVDIDAQFSASIVEAAENYSQSVADDNSEFASLIKQSEEADLPALIAEFDERIAPKVEAHSDAIAELERVRDERKTKAQAEHDEFVAAEEKELMEAEAGRAALVAKLASGHATSKEVQQALASVLGSGGSDG